MQWIERIKKFIKPERESVVIENFDFPDSTHIFLIGFSYDIPTKQTFTWIENLLVKSTEQHKISRFHNHEFNKSDLFKLIKSKINRVEIFCGHGDFIGLYGPPQDTDILRKMHSIIYDGNVIEVGPSSMFAFCCRAADSFGREFSSKPGNAFMGFNGDLSFPTELYEDLRYIFQTITKDIIQRGKIEKEHKDLFINEIDKLIQNVEKRYNDPDLSDRIGSYLLEYKDLFRVFV